MVTDTQLTRAEFTKKCNAFAPTDNTFSNHRKKQFSAHFIVTFAVDLAELAITELPVYKYPSL